MRANGKPAPPRALADDTTVTGHEDNLSDHYKAVYSAALERWRR